MKQLRNDICRCHNDGCAEKDICLRWIQRDTGRVHAQSLKSYDNPLDSKCDCKIEKD